MGLLRKFILSVSLLSIALCAFPFNNQLFAESLEEQAEQAADPVEQELEDAVQINEVKELVKERGRMAVEKIKDGAPDISIAFKKHPWQKTGRKKQDSLKDWKGDSLAMMGAEAKEFDKNKPSDLKERGIRKTENAQGNNFHECFEPRLDMDEWDEKGKEYDENGKPIDTEKIYGKKGTPRCPYCWPKILRPEKKEDGTCPLRTNHGEVWEYWWPEYEIEVNDFGISAINTKKTFEQKELMHRALNKAKNAHYKALYQQNIELMNKTWQLETKLAEFKDNKLLRGESQTGGLTPNNQYQTFEAHGYKSMVQIKNHSFPKVRQNHGKMENIYFPTDKDPCTPYPFWYNGYIYRNNYACFDDSLPKRIIKKKKSGQGGEEGQEDDDEGLDYGQSGEQKNKEKDDKKKWVSVWTEQFPQVAPYWRYEEFAQKLNKELYEAMNPCAGKYRQQCVDPKAGDRSQDWFNICSWCRQEHFAEANLSLPQFLKKYALAEPEKKDIACRLCYYGGGSGWPATGTLMGHHDLTTGPAVIARRYAKLVQELRNKNISAVKDSDFPNFTDFQGDKPEEKDKYIDKFQMVYPRVSRCYRLNPTEKEYENSKPFGQKSQEPNKEKEVPFVWEFGLDKQTLNKEFPPDLVAPNQMGSVRFAFWNRRTIGSCQFRSIIENNGLKKGEEKEDGEKKVVKNYDGTENKLIEAVRKELNDEKKFYTRNISKSLTLKIGAKDQGWGCQAYDGFKYSKLKQGEKERRIKGRGNGDQKPEDKLYGTKALGYDKDNAYACSAYQIYPFKQFIDEEVQKKLRACRKLFNPPKDAQEDEKKWDDLVKKELKEEEQEMNAPDNAEEQKAEEDEANAAEAADAAEEAKAAEAAKTTNPAK